MSTLFSFYSIVIGGPIGFTNLRGDDISLWPLWVIPIFWIFIIPIIAVLCSIVMYISMLYLKMKDCSKIIRKTIIKVTCFSFLCDLMAVGIIILIAYFVGKITNLTSNYYNWYNSFDDALGTKPLDNIFAILTLGVSILLSRIINYKLNKRYTFSKLDIEEENKKKLALAIAIFTAPYIFFFSINI